MIPGPFLLVFLIKLIIFLRGELALAYLPATSKRRLFRGRCYNRKSVLLFFFFSLWACYKRRISQRRGYANVNSGASLPCPPPPLLLLDCSGAPICDRWGWISEGNRVFCHSTPFWVAVTRLITREMPGQPPVRPFRRRDLSALPSGLSRTDAAPSSPLARFHNSNGTL